MTRQRIAILGVIASAYVVACVVPDLDLSGHGCPCVAGYECDVNANRCVPNGSIVDNDASTDTTHLIDVIQVASGADHTCALRSTGEVFCWGDNTFKQLGNASAGASSARAVKVANLEKIRSIAAGSNHTCAVDGNESTGGTISCWGSNASGQLGNPSAGPTSAVPVTVAKPTGILLLAAGKNYACALDTSGTVSCWGSNDSGQLAGPPADTSLHPNALQAATSRGAQEIATGNEVTCSVVSETPATLECWGSSTRGEIPTSGDASVFPTTRVSFVDGGAGAAHVAVGALHVCATDTSGNAYCWGSNDYGETAQSSPIGAGTNSAPALVAGVTGVAAIGAGENYSCALTVAKYGVSCWGRNVFGTLGNSQPGTSDPPQPAPQAVAGLAGVGQISVGAHHACAVIKPVPTPGQADTVVGPVYCWGDNEKGELGDGTMQNQRDAPVQVLVPNP